MDEYPFLQSSDAGHQTRKTFEEHAAADARARLNQIVAAAEAEGVACGTDLTTSTTPYRDIVAAATRHGCDVIFMASHGRRGLAGLLVGSETQKVLTHCTIPVLVYR
ncbi:Universal stress protein (fragment) [Cupriavidus necator]|uniref:Universal stress protein n=1 Tax=Cupriavidus necator TaxID=106590 RepID=A0A1K0IK32_CUPNE